MTNVCFYFQVHQPYRLNKYTVFDIGNNHNYYDKKKNKEIMQRITKKCYLPTNKLLLKLIKENKGNFKISFSITGTAIEQFKEYAPEVLDSFKELAQTGCVEFLGETYYHSLSHLYSKTEFIEQVNKHKKITKELFGKEPTTFRNTELIYNNELAKLSKEMGFKGIIAEGADHILGWRSPNQIYSTPTGNKVLLKNYKLSDDIAFRFSNKNWNEYPLTPQKFANWIQTNKDSQIINLFMDYETFGEHLWEDTGIFKFLEALPKEILKNNKFITPGEAIQTFEAKDEFNTEEYVSWADLERDLSAWVGNKMQQESLKEIYLIEEMVKKTNDKTLIENWRKLQTSDHFYYMSTKFFADGDVHNYFNPYNNPYDAFIAFTNIMNDLVQRAKDFEKKEQKVEVITEENI